MWVNNSLNLVCKSTVLKCIKKRGFSLQISEETINHSQSAYDNNRLSKIQNLINHLTFEDEPANALIHDSGT